MDFLNVMQTYFRGEKIEAALFIAPVGLLLVGIAIGAWRSESGALMWGAVVPAAIFGLMLAGTGIGIAAISATYNMTDPDPERLAAGRRAFIAICELTSGMGCHIVTVCSGSKHAKDKWRRHPSNDDPQSWTEMCREFDIICDHADRHGVLVGVEPEPANIVSNAMRAADLLAAFPGGPIRMVLDPANLIEDVTPESHERTIDQALDRLGPMTVLAHAKDRHADGAVVPAGKGVIDWPHFLRGLEACGFDGPLIAHGMSQSDAPAVAEFLTSRVRRLVP